ncbi:hypothetical protein MGYG_07873 [Nannizzia gypsea CBS 118893]|uniref:assimilatory sulfite reductase (NADPH) n=1 Tax=Arthroderma gypseum (strain ATCC MYA-4604 / CBS 118893) TaxID=535722 RepID=E4V4E6_ARTGP|nr:hypothetical protein MGYG_07873 [Nannizzia gypsea CBS 118893]EFR04870.1 hypothetical protein MGYG_07873 [Nannizzia gypsea CBS 118893]
MTSSPPFRKQGEEEGERRKASSIRAESRHLSTSTSTCLSNHLSNYLRSVLLLEGSPIESKIMLQLRLLRPSLASLPLLPSLRPHPTVTTTRAASSDSSGGINTDRGEYSKSGGDSEVAAQRSAYDICYRDPADVRTASDREEEANGHYGRQRSHASLTKAEGSTTKKLGRARGCRRARADSWTMEERTSPAIAANSLTIFPFTSFSFSLSLSLLSRISYPVKYLLPLTTSSTASLLPLFWPKTVRAVKVSKNRGEEKDEHAFFSSLPPFYSLSPYSLLLLILLILLLLSLLFINTTDTITTASTMASTLTSTRLGAGSLALGFLGERQKLKRKRSEKEKDRAARVVVPVRALGCVRASLEQAALLSLPLVVHLVGDEDSSVEDSDACVEMAAELGVTLISCRQGEEKETTALAVQVAPSMVLHMDAAVIPAEEDAVYDLPQRKGDHKTTSDQYEYYGPEDAVSVVAVFGHAAASDALKATGVMVVKFWPVEAEEIVKVIPGTVKTVGVLGGQQESLFRQMLPLSLRVSLVSLTARTLAEFTGTLAEQQTEDKEEKIVVEEEQQEVENKVTVEDITKGLLFKEALGAKTTLPKLPVKTYAVTVKENRRLTPTHYHRHIFHLELDLGDSGLTYEIGEALGVHPENSREEVEEFAAAYPLDLDEIVSYQTEEGRQAQTVYQALRRLDLWGRPPKKFYLDLSEHATDTKEKERLAYLASPAAKDEFKQRSEVDMLTYADILQEFPSARPAFTTLAAMVGPVKRREYSIASCQRLAPSIVALMVVVVGWKDGRGRARSGHASTYLSRMSPGAPLTVSVKPSVMKLPTDPMAPLIMAGLGTGLAPFRAFVQHRALEKSLGREVGPVLLYIGARHQREEYCYGEEWEAYAASGVITLLSTAFSRDQLHKVYIQDRMRQTLPQIADAYLAKHGSFYLCGPTWPVPDVTAVLEEAVASLSVDTKIDTRAEMDRLKDQHRFVLEVY